MANIITLSGGDLGGAEVDFSDWPIGKEREFAAEDGRTLLYRKTEAGGAVFCGEKPA